MRKFSIRIVTNVNEPNPITKGVVSALTWQYAVNSLMNENRIYDIQVVDVVVTEIFS